MKKELNESITLLKDLVKESHIKGQMHLDFTLAPAEKIEEYKIALMTTRNAIQNGIMTENEFKELLGLL